MDQVSKPKFYISKTNYFYSSHYLNFLTIELHQNRTSGIENSLVHEKGVL